MDGGAGVDFRAGGGPDVDFGQVRVPASTSRVGRIRTRQCPFSLRVPPELAWTVVTKKKLLMAGRP